MFRNVLTGGRPKRLVPSALNEPVQTNAERHWHQHGGDTNCKRFHCTPRVSMRSRIAHHSALDEKFCGLIAMLRTSVEPGKACASLARDQGPRTGPSLAGRPWQCALSRIVAYFRRECCV